MTHNAPVYLVGSGATIDLFILLISACMSWPRNQKVKQPISQLKPNQKLEETMKIKGVKGIDA